LKRKWARELDYRLGKNLWCFTEKLITVRFEYESHDKDGQWWRSRGNELCEFGENGLMRRRAVDVRSRLVRGAEKVARFLLAVATEAQIGRFLRSVGSEPIVADLRVRVAPVNGGLGILVVSGYKPISALVLDVSEGVVRTIHLVANPEKLAGVRGIETP
jgi:hypothetical protein